MEKILKILLFLPILALSTKAEWVVKSYQEIKNERVIRQTYEQSCGASSLATLLNILDDQKKFDELELLKIMSGQELYTDMVIFKVFDFKNVFVFIQKIINFIIFKIYIN